MIIAQELLALHGGRVAGETARQMSTKRSASSRPTSSEQLVRGLGRVAGGAELSLAEGCGFARTGGTETETEELSSSRSAVGVELRHPMTSKAIAANVGFILSV